MDRVAPNAVAGTSRRGRVLALELMEEAGSEMVFYLLKNLESVKPAPS